MPNILHSGVSTQTCIYYPDNITVPTIKEIDISKLNFTGNHFIEIGVCNGAAAKISEVYLEK